MNRDPAKLYPDFYERFKNVWREMKDNGQQIFITEGWRSIETQEEYYSLGRDVPGDIITWAKPYQSYHHYGLAVDVAFYDKEPWSEDHPWQFLGHVAKKHGCQWGGDWGDRPHIYKTYGLTWQELANVYKKYDLAQVWAYIDGKRPRNKEETVMAGEHGIKESKEVLVAVLGHVAPLLIKRFKDGIQLGEDLSAIIAKWSSDDEFKAALKEGMDGVSKVPAEISDLDLNEGLELGVVAISQVPKIVEALK